METLLLRCPAHETSRFEDQRFCGLVFTGLLALAAALRIAAFFDLKYSVYFDFMLWDERLYHEWARQIAQGTFASGEVYEFAPLPAYFMALIYRIFSPQIVYIRYANIAFGTATCALVYLIGRRLGSRQVGLGAMLIAAVYKPFIFYSIVPLKTALALVLFAAAVYLLLATVDGRGALYALFSGFFLQLFTNVRPNAVVLVPLVALVIAAARGGRSIKALKVAAILVGGFAAGVILAQSPFMLRNYLAAGEAAPMTSQGGIHLYMSHNFDYPKGIPFVTTSPSERGVQFTIEASRRLGRKLSATEADRYWRQQAVDNMRRHPGATLARWGHRLLAVFNWYEPGDHYQIDFIRRFVGFFKLPFLPFWIVMPLGMAGMLAVFDRHRRPAAALAVVFWGYAATLVLFFINIRMRLPLLIVLIPLAAAGIGNLAAAWHGGRRRWFAALALVAAGFLALSWLPVGKPWDLAGFYNTHAIILRSQGREAEAVQWWERSSALNGHYSAFADLSLSQYHAGHGDLDRALAYANRIPEESYAAALKYALLGDLYLQRRELRRALGAYERSLVINSGQRVPRLKLARLYQRIDPRRAREEYTKLAWVDQFYERYMPRSPKGGG